MRSGDRYLRPQDGALAPDEAIVLLHLPKTGGTSLRVLVKSNLDGGMFGGPWPRFLEVDPARLHDYRFFYGHVFFEIRRLLPWKPIFITMLRDPFTRALSEYRLVQRDTTHPRHERVRSQSFEEYLNEKNLRVYVRYLTDRPMMTDDGLDFRRMRSRHSEQRAIQVACDRLSRFRFVGLTERYAESVRLLCASIGWEVPPTLPEAKKAPTPTRLEDISSEAMEIIAEHARADIAIYEFAKGLVEERLATV